MSKIKAVDFAKYVDDNRKLGIDILNSKNINSTNHDSLNTVINNIAKLPDSPKEETKYDYPQEFKDLISAYENDPLLEMNGGEYNKCVYYGLENDYDKSVIYAYIDMLVITSDGQYITPTSTGAITITWDTTKDLIRENGKGWRWIKVYRTVGSNFEKSNNLEIYGCYPETNVLYKSPLKFVLIDGIHKITSGSQSYYNINRTDIECIVLGKSSPYVVLGTSQTTDLSKPTYEEGNSIYINKGSLRYFKNLNGIAGIIKCNNKVVFDKLEGMFSLVSNIMYDGVIDLVLNNDDIYLDLNSIKNGDSYRLFNDTLQANGKYLGNSFNSNICGVRINKLLFPNIEEWGTYSIATQYIPFLEYIYIGDSLTTSFTLPHQLLNIKYIRIPTNYAYDLSLSTAYTLTKECVLDIFNQIADLTNSTTLTLKLASRYKYILTDEELAIATNKNWTISFV